MTLNPGTNTRASDNRRSKGAFNARRVANMGFTPVPPHTPTITWFGEAIRAQQKRQQPSWIVRALREGYRQTSIPAGSIWAK